jgi:predicted neuraminidase
MRIRGGRRARRRSIFGLIGLAGALLGGCALLTPQPAPAQPGADGGNPRPGLVSEEFVFETAPFPSCHASTLVETDAGLVCAFFGGSYERHPDVGIWVSRQVGGAWTPPVEVANGVYSDVVRLPTWNPVLFKPRGGDLMLFFKIGPTPHDMWGMSMTSADNGATWSQPRRMIDAQGQMLIGPVKNKPVQLAGGEILAGSSTEGDGWKVHIERSVDGGQSWDAIGPLNASREFNAIQPTIFTHADGRLQVLCRSQQSVITESWSEDGGATWSPMRATPLPNPSSGIDGVTLADGRHLLVYNHSTREQEGVGPKGRGILNIALSSDGKLWEAAMVLEHLDEPGKQFSYPSVIQTADGMVHIVYTWHRERIKHAVLDPNLLRTTPMPDGVWPQ